MLAVGTAVQCSVQFINPIDARNARIGVPRQRDQIHPVFIEVDGTHDHHVRMEGIAAFPRPALVDTRRFIIHADKHDVHDTVHHARICHFGKFVIGIRRGSRRAFDHL